MLFIFIYLEILLMKSNIHYFTFKGGIRDMYKKIIGILVCILFFGASIVSGINIQIKDIDIRNRGTTHYVGGSGGGNYSTIQSALDAANPGDTVFVYDDSSPYYENIIINKNHTRLIGEDKNTTVINGDGSGNIIDFDYYFNNVTISGFKLINGEYGIYMHRFNDYNIISNNIIIGLDRGINVWGDYNTYMYNTISNCDPYGILTYKSDYNIFSYNNFEYNHEALHFSNGDEYNKVFNNFFDNNNCGIEIDYAGRSNYNSIFNNYFSNSHGSHAVDSGINFWNITKTPGVNIVGGPYLGGNYWDNYTGPDLDHDGIGDTPYIIPYDYNEDYLPLIIWENNPPQEPSINGPNSGKKGTTYDFKFNTNDPDEDDIKFIIDWGDNNSETTAYYPSGTEVTVPHTWTEIGTFVITVYAEDEFGMSSDDTTFGIAITRVRVINTPFHWLQNFLQNHPNLFPIIRQLLGL